MTGKQVARLETPKQLKWINCAKCVAILAVLVDHTNGVLYTNQNIAMASYFSVSLFILLAGVTIHWSNERKFFDGFNCVGSVLKNRVWKIALPYMVATFIYQIVIFRYFDFNQYVGFLLHFNASGPFYYILLYLQLTAVSPILYAMIRKSRTWKYPIVLQAFGLVGVVYVAYLTTNYSNILEIYGGGVSY